MNPIHLVWTAAVQTPVFNHSANLACLQKSKVLCAAPEQAAFLLPEHCSPKQGRLQVHEAKDQTTPLQARQPCTPERTPSAPEMGPCHVTRKINVFSHLAWLWEAGKVSVQGDTSSSCSQAHADQLCTVTCYGLCKGNLLVQQMLQQDTCP